MRSGRRDTTGTDWHCSFCGKPQGEAAKLISSPSRYPRAYICDECVRGFHSLLSNDPSVVASVGRPVQRMRHQAAVAELMTAIVEWTTRESRGDSAVEELNEVRRLGRLVRTEDDN